MYNVHCIMPYIQGYTHVWHTSQCSLGRPGQHEEQADNVGQEELVVAEADTVVDPGAVMVQARHAAVAGRTVLRAQGPANQAGGAEVPRLKPCRLTQLCYHLEEEEEEEEGGREGEREGGKGVTKQLIRTVERGYVAREKSVS